jgi:hypothetical protein
MPAHRGSVLRFPGPRESGFRPGRHFSLRLVDPKIGRSPRYPSCGCGFLCAGKGGTDESRELAAPTTAAGMTGNHRCLLVQTFALAGTRGFAITRPPGYRDGLLAARRLGDRFGIAFLLEALPPLAAAQGESYRGAVLSAAAQTFREITRFPLSPSATSHTHGRPPAGLDPRTTTRSSVHVSSALASPAGALTAQSAC